MAKTATTGKIDPKVLSSTKGVTVTLIKAVKKQKVGAKVMVSESTAAILRKKGLIK